jgi:hypothetical protein
LVFREIIKADTELYRSHVTDEVLDFPGSIFYHPDFLLTAAEILKLQFQPYLCFCSGKLAGFANTFRGGKLKIRTCAIPRLFQYYGPVATDDAEQVLHMMINALARDFDVAVLSLIPEANLETAPGGWQKTDRLTYYLTPDTYDNMHRKSFRNVKKNANKAIRSGVSFERADSFNYEVYEASFKRNGIQPPVNEDQLIAWIDRLTRLKLAETYRAVVDDKTAAACVLLIYKGYASAWVGGSLPEYLGLGVNNFLMLKIGEQLYHKNIKVWDLVGGDIESIGAFKRSFGSEPVKHVQIEKAFTLKGKIYRQLMKLRAKLHA